MSKKPNPKYDGLTRANCCNDCNKDRCVISEAAYCGHPYKAALSSISPATVSRVQEARKIIQHQMIDKGQ